MIYMPENGVAYRETDRCPEADLVSSFGGAGDW